MRQAQHCCLCCCLLGTRDCCFESLLHTGNYVPYQQAVDCISPPKGKQALHKLPPSRAEELGPRACHLHETKSRRGRSQRRGRARERERELNPLLRGTTGLTKSAGAAVQRRSIAPVHAVQKVHAIRRYSSNTQQSKAACLCSAAVVVVAPNGGQDYS